MRGDDNRTGELFSYVDLEARRDHPLRGIRTIVNEALAVLERELAALYSLRPSIPPEKLLRAMLLQAFYSIRSERLLMERLEYDLLFSWFVGIGVDEFSKNRDRLLEGDIAAKFLAAMLALPRVKGLLSSDHFSVDGMLIEAWASMKSVKPKDRATGARRRAQRRSELPRPETLQRHPCFDRRSGCQALPQGERQGDEAVLHRTWADGEPPRLLVDACLTQANGHAERVAALHMIEQRADRPTAITLGADKAYDAEDFVNELRSMNVTPHVAQNTSGRSSAIDGRTTRHGGYAVSQRIRKRIEEAFGWIKTVAGQEKTSFRGRDRVAWAFTFAATAYNLVRLPKLIAEADGQGARLRPGLCRPLAHRRNGQLGQRLPRPCRRGASHLRRQVRWRNRLWGSEGLPRHALRQPRRIGLPSSRGRGTTRMIRPVVADGP
ncbi:transposase [Bradyrhizobium sp. USDA 4501]